MVTTNFNNEILKIQKQTETHTKSMIQAFWKVKQSVEFQRLKRLEFIRTTQPIRFTP